MHAWIGAGLLGLVLVLAAVSDWRTGKVPNALTYPAVALGFLWAGVCGLIGEPPSGVLDGLQSAAIGFGAAFIPFAILFAAGGIGGGDVKLMAAVGTLSASWQCVLSAAVYAFIIGAVMAVFLMIRHGLVRQTLRRMMGAALLGARGVSAAPPEQRHRVPFAVAIAAGGLLAVAETMLGLPTPWAGFVY